MKCVNVTSTITASGKMLPPLMIFKGASYGCVTTCKFVMFPAVGKYECRQNAGMD